MEPSFSGLVIDPAKCNELNLEEKRELVHEISQWAENAPEILQSWSRRELLQLICAEMGKERKYTGVTKPKMISHLLRLVSEKKTGKPYNDKTSASTKSQNGFKKKRKKEQLELANKVELDHTMSNTEKQVNIMMCRNLACRATVRPEDKYCKRCSCCICYLYDDNKDPSLWLVCNSDPPFRNDSCGLSCHLKCALKHERAGILKNGCYTRLDGSFYCVCCGKVNWLIRSWLKQILAAKDARRVDVLCDRLSLGHKILKGTERYNELHTIVNAAVKKLKKEVGPLDKVSATMARGIVNRLACGAEVQKLCSVAVETLDSMLSGTADVPIDADLKASVSRQALRIHFEDISSTSVVVSLQSRDETFEENVIGCRIWHRSSDATDYPEEPTSITLRPASRVKICGLSPSTEYYVKASPFGITKELGKWESRCVTQKLEEATIIQADSQRGSTNSSDKNVDLLPTPLETVLPLVETPCKGDRLIGSPDSANKKEEASKSGEREFEYCVKVIRWLECEGHMEKEFRVKLLTWFSLKATAQERRVVSVIIDVLIDEPESLVAQLIDAFVEGVCKKDNPIFRKGLDAALNSRP